MITGIASIAKHAKAPACAFAWLIFSASAAFSVPGPLDDAHHNMDRTLTDFVRKVQYYDRDVPYVRTQLKYAGLLDFDGFKAYRRTLLRYNGSKIKTASVADRKAFWINTYNALVIDGVLAEYPLGSTGEVPGPTVRSVPDFFTRPRPLAGDEVSLQQIEKHLREFRDPRVWFALHQAAVSSPRLPEKAYNPTDLEDQLDAAVTNHLADPMAFRINQAKNEMTLSEVFLVRAEAISEGDAPVPPELSAYPALQQKILAFILPRLRPPHRTLILEKRPAITFEPFNWALNEAE